METQHAQLQAMFQQTTRLSQDCTFNEASNESRSVLVDNNGFHGENTIGILVFMSTKRDSAQDGLEIRRRGLRTLLMTYLQENENLLVRFIYSLQLKPYVRVVAKVIVSLLFGQSRGLYQKNSYRALSLS